MQRTVSLLAAGSLTLAAAGAGQAATLVVGGLAGECSSRAHAGRHGGEDLEVCSRAIDSESLSSHDLAGTYVNRGAMELGSGMNEAAHADFQAALRIAPRTGEAHIGEGAYLIGMERFGEAEGEISHGLQLGSEEAEKGYYFRALARWGQEDFKGAYDDFNRAIRLKPGWALPREQLKNFHVETGR